MFEPLKCSVGAGALWAALAGLPSAFAADAPATITMKPGEAIAPSARTIYRQVDKDGNVVFSDRADRSASEQATITFQPSSDASSLARAHQEREYWRRQAESFAARQRDRERELERIRRVRAIQEIENNRYYLVPGLVVRGAPPFGDVVPGGAIAGTYSSSPGAAAAAGSAFIGSGFGPSRR